jgi:hypothetical protein
MHKHCEKIAIMYIVIIAFIFLTSLPVAAASRVNLLIDKTTSPAGAPIDVKIQLLQGNSSDADASTGEKAEIKIRDAKEGQSCTTDPSPSDNEGIVRGSCNFTDEGEMTIYATSKDRGDFSEDKTLKFTKKENPSPAVDQPGKQQNSQQTSSQQSDQVANAIVNQEGLVKDQNEEPLAEGLKRDAETIAGETDSVAQAATHTTNDIDLLTSLIFLTAGIILLIGGVYIIYLQARKHNNKKKLTNFTTTPPIS